jgi:uncharacterized membrane protein
MTTNPPQEHSAERAPWGWLAALMLLAAALRAVALNQQLWYDEITTLVEFVRRPLGEIVTTYTSQNQHMLYSVLARIAVSIFGEHAWSLRLPAVVFGVLTVPALYLFARLAVTRREALLASALLAVSYHHIWFSQNARGYTGLALWTLLTTYCFVRGMREPSAAGWKWWMWFAVATALGIYTHLTMGFVTAAQGMVWLGMVVTRRKTKDEGQKETAARSAGWQPLAGFALAAALTALLYAPVMGEMLRRTVGSETARGALEVTRAEWRNPLWLVLETARGLAGGSEVIGLAVLLMGGLVVLAGVWNLWRRDAMLVALLLLPGVVTAAAMLALSRNLWPRFFFFAIGFALLLVVRGVFAWCEGPLARLVGESAARKWAVAAFSVLILASCWQARAAWIYPKQDFRGAMGFVDTQRAPGDAVVLIGLTRLPYQEYYRRDWPAVESAAELEGLRARGGATWALYTLPIYVQSRYPELWNILQRDFRTVRVFRGTMGGGEVYVCRADAAGTGQP